MIIGIGMDIVEIDRIARALERRGGRLRHRVYTEEECIYCDRGKASAASYAARFAAKEAFLKALGHGLAEGIQWKEVEVTRDPSGKPGITLSGTARELFEKAGGTDILVTLTHSREAAAATVILVAEKHG